MQNLLSFVDYYISSLEIVKIRIIKPRYNWNIVETGVKHHSPHNKTDHYDRAEILLKIALNTITLTSNS